MTADRDVQSVHSAHRPSRMPQKRFSRGGPLLWHSPCSAMTWRVNDRTHRNSGCGNDAPVEITERFPQELGNLAGEREIPTFSQAIPLSFREEERRMNRPQTGSLSDRRTGLLSERRKQRTNTGLFVPARTDSASHRAVVIRGVVSADRTSRINPYVLVERAERARP